MKNIKAILIAFLMFAVTVTAVKFVATKEMPKYSVSMEHGLIRLNFQVIRA